MTNDRLTALCRDLSLRLTERPSVTGSLDEGSFGPWLEGTLRDLPHWGDNAEVWSFPVELGDPRHCVAMLVRGQGEATVVLTGHYDTVTVADYGDLASLATRPDTLASVLVEPARPAPSGTAAARCRDDLASGRFVPGRGLLDMKAGLAAGLAAMAEFAEAPDRRGNLLFLAVPDEENASAGARAAAAQLGNLARERGLDLRAAVNLDAIADDGDGTAGRVVAMGTVGKVLPTALVVGAPVHGGFPLRGINAAVLAGAIAVAVEWAPELTDETAEEPGTPISLLQLKDGKQGYDVTTPGTAWLYWNALNHRREPASILDTLEGLVREALERCLSDLRARAARSGQPAGMIAEVSTVPVMRHGDLLDQVHAREPGIMAEQGAEARRLSAQGLPFPDICRHLTERLWQRSGLEGPAVVLGLGSIPYLATEVRDDRLRAAVEQLVAAAPAQHGTRLRVVDYFAGISDMSFFGQGDTGAFARLARDTPGWDACVGLGDGSLAQVPTINLGPWGRDYHTPWERIEADFGFRVLPRLLLELCGRLLE